MGTPTVAGRCSSTCFSISSTRTPTTPGRPAIMARLGGMADQLSVRPPLCEDVTSSPIGRYRGRPSSTVGGTALGSLAVLERLAPVTAVTVATWVSTEGLETGDRAGMSRQAIATGRGGASRPTSCVSQRVTQAVPAIGSISRIVYLRQPPLGVTGQATALAASMLVGVTRS